MKVCRMCWALLDDQLNRCNCIQGADPSIFFKDTSEMVNHFVTHERLMSKRARRLEELVKERLKGAYKSGHKKFSDEIGYLEQELQSLVDESEKTVKEKGSVGTK